LDTIDLGQVQGIFEHFTIYVDEESTEFEIVLVDNGAFIIAK